MFIGQWRGYFFLNLLAKEAKIIRTWLVLRLASNSFRYREAFSCKNGISYASTIVDEGYIEELKDKSENENTKNS